MSEYSLKVTLPPFRNKFYKDGKPYLNNFVIKTGTNEDYEIVNEEEMDNLRYSKNQIDNVCNNKDWDTSKKITNPYELIYSPYDNTNISNYVPISRSFFKMWEILNKFEIMNNTESSIISNIAEGPGGFIEAILKYRQGFNDCFISNTLYPTNKSIPSWFKLKKLIQQNNSNNINLCYCDLFDLDSIITFIDHFKDNKADIVTADGGFDYSQNFNTQEEQSYKIIYSEHLLFDYKVLNHLIYL